MFIDNGYISDDISFCPHNCKRSTCSRNKINIRYPQYPHSYFVDTPYDCPKIYEKEQKEKKMKITKFDNETNKDIIKEICSIDKTGIFEALGNLAVEHGMPIENLAGFLLDMTHVINRWSDMMHGKLEK